MAPLATILMYNDLRNCLGPAALADQLDRLVAAGRPVVKVAAIVSALAGGPPLPQGAVALTFDHGLADHARRVLPLLMTRGLVAAFFVPVAPIVERRVIAAHKLRAVLAAADCEQDVIAAVYDLVAEHRRSSAALAKPPMPWNGHDGGDWDRQMTFITRLLRSGLPAALREEVVDQLFETFVTDDETAFADNLYLSPGQVRVLAAAGMEIGGQGLTATNLQGLPYRTQLREIAATATFLRRKLGVGEGLAFAYPHGGWDEATLELLPAHGFAAGLTAHPDHVGFDTDPFLLPRFDAGQDFERALGS